MKKERETRRKNREAQKDEFNRNIKEKIDEIKDIDLDFEIEYTSWKNFKKDIYEQSDYESFSLDEKKEFDLLFETQIKPILESYSKIFDNINI
jgi:hypothetical protein